MNFDEIVARVNEVVAKPTLTDFIYDLLVAYGKSPTGVSRLRGGSYNKSKDPSVVLWKSQVRYEIVRDKLHSAVEIARSAKDTLAHHPRFLIATDLSQLVALDLKTGEGLDCQISELGNHADFFLPWAGREKAPKRLESLADKRSAERMADFFDALVETNAGFDRHALNLFLTRVLFCLFAEDTGIFRERSVSRILTDIVAGNGSETAGAFEQIFAVLNKKRREDLPEYLAKLPFVNGGLFAEQSPVPAFSAKAHNLLITACSQRWSSINPDIFGSMYQAVADPELRSELGMQYTSISNIQKVLGPLFMDRLHADLERFRGNEKGLRALHARIERIRVFDPACGSGNFLITAYKMLRNLEMALLIELAASTGQQENMLSRIHVSHFSGIEVDPFAREIAVLSMWLAEHQMNLIAMETVGVAHPLLPLADSARIISGNANLVAWSDVCPTDPALEVYIVGNPPYVGARNQTPDQKAEMEAVFAKDPDYKNADYIAAWFLKAGDFIRRSPGKVVEAGFVSTNSICQGESVGILWPRLLGDLEISFAHEPFRWTNSASGRKAGVTCIIAGIRRKTTLKKVIFSERSMIQCDNINPYLFAGPNVIVRRTKVPITPRKKMVFGNQPRDGGHLILSAEERESLISNYPAADRYIRRYVGTKDFLYDIVRYTLWLQDEDIDAAQAIPEIKRRVDDVRAFRLSSDAATTRAYAKTPHLLAQRAHKPGCSILIPGVSSENRDYIPIGLFDDRTIISNSALVIYSNDIELFGILSSRMHQLWFRTVGGGMKTDPRYAAEICYNTFPLPEIGKGESLGEAAMAVLAARERFPGKTAAELYDADSMPTDLRNAHQRLDLSVERLYQQRPFRSDVERLDLLFTRYNGTLTT